MLGGQTQISPRRQSCSFLKENYTTTPLANPCKNFNNNKKEQFCNWLGSEMEVVILIFKAHDNDSYQEML